MSVLWQQRTHGVQRRREQDNRPIALLFLAIVVVALLLAAAYGALAGANAKLGAQVWKLEKDLVVQQRENQVLMVEIARLSSIPVLQERAIALGFVEANTVEYLEVTEP
jgi:cell division protein FtsB